MKILFIAHEVGLNGASKSLLNLIEEFQDNIDVHVLVKGEGMLSKALQEKKCHVIVKKYYLDAEKQEQSKIVEIIKTLRYFLLHKPINLITAFSVSRYIRKHRIDIVHTNSSSTFMGAFIKRFTPRIKHIWHFREFLFEDFGMLPLAGWRALYKYVNKYTDAVITISDAVNHKYIARFQTPRFLIYNGLPDVNEHYAPENRDTFNLIQSGIISPVKGVDVSVKAIQILHKQGYENVHLYLAGKGDLEFCREDYENVKPYVHLLGYVNNLNEIRQKKMDAELVCSKSEAFGRVTIEAMQNGMIVVGADTGGTKELIHDGKDGFLFRMGDANDLAEKIRMIIDQKVDLQYIKENALLNAKEFSIAKCANSIRTLYADILKGE